MRSLGSLYLLTSNKALRPHTVSKTVNKVKLQTCAKRLQTTTESEFHIFPFSKC